MHACSVGGSVCKHLPCCIESVKPLSVRTWEATHTPFWKDPLLMRLFNIRTSRISASGLQFVDLVLTNSPETALLLWETTVRQDHQRETNMSGFLWNILKLIQSKFKEETADGGAAWLKCHLVQNDTDDDDFDDVSAGIRRQKRDLIWILLILLRPTSTRDCFHAPTSPPGPAHRGFLQHRNVHALLPWTDAVDH